MEITVLGSAGGEAPGQRLTGFRIGEDLLLDAGTIGLQLSLEDQRKIRSVAITHAHLDHIHALPFLLDNLIGRVPAPVTVYGLPEVLETIRQHILNGKVWPDFSILPSPENPVLKFHPVHPGQPVEAGEYLLEAVATSHSVASAGFLINAKGRTAAFTGDTGPTEKFWQRLKHCGGLAALFMECSFPRSQQAMADLTHHLSTEGVLGELEKLGKPEIPVFLYHLKPEFFDQIAAEAEAIPNWRLAVARPGDVIRVS